MCHACIKTICNQLIMNHPVSNLVCGLIKGVELEIVHPCRTHFRVKLQKINYLGIVFDEYEFLVMAIFF